MNEVLALKYRPQTFDEVIGQDLIVQQLKSALEKENLGHTLLFCGTRGTGKTTVARIVAAELNKTYFERFKDVDPRRAQGKLGGWIIDEFLKLVVLEIDAASNTGVDHVRELQETLHYSGKGHRVVILDEAHMLSKSAFNALLKTLEEPPPKTTFILVTTEPHRLPDTVKSRCQIYEFQEVDVETLVEHYKDIAEREGIGAGLSDEQKRDRVRPAALRANGSVRDGLSILQKWFSGELEESTIAYRYFDLVAALYIQDVTTALALVGEIKKVEEARVIIQTLERWFHACALESFGMKTFVRDFFEGRDMDFDLRRLQKAFDDCIDAERALSATPNSKIVLDMAILKMTL